MSKFWAFVLAVFYDFLYQKLAARIKSWKKRQELKKALASGNIKRANQILNGDTISDDPGLLNLSQKEFLENLKSNNSGPTDKNKT